MGLGWLNILANRNIIQMDKKCREYSRNQALPKKETPAMVIRR